MKMLKDSSEIREARDLLLRIMAAPQASAARTPPAPESEPPAGDAALAGPGEPPPEAAPRDTSTAPIPAQVAPAPPAPVAVPPPLPPVWAHAEPEHAEARSLALEVESLVSAPSPPVVEEQVPPRAPTPAAQPDYVSASRGERLHAVLSALCDSEGYAGAMVTDASGLPLATSRNLEASDSLAAFSSVLGDVLSKAASYLGHDDASHVTMDVGERQKVVLRRFFFEERGFYLVVICLRVLETHRALDRTVPQIVLTLGSS
jgi:predicted regulator of Ras-like GTPase activity (Roadblock/LC7/MglB family)